MSKSKTVCMVVLSVFLLACTTTAHYQPLPWAKMSFEQTVAQCRYDIQANPMIGFDACMERYGWRATN